MKYIIMGLIALIIYKLLPLIIDKYEKNKEAQKEKNKEEELIKKYGEKFGRLVYARELEIGMTKEMISNIIDDYYDDGNNICYVRSIELPSNIERIFEEECDDYDMGLTRLTFSNLQSTDQDIIDSIDDIDSFWIGMPKKTLEGIWGEPEDEKQNVTKDKIKLKWYYGGRTTRQGTIVYKCEVRLENDIVEGWKDLE